MKPECIPFRDDIEAYALRALESEEEARVRLHLRGCAECADIAESYRLAVEQLSLATPTYRAPTRLRGRPLHRPGRLHRVSSARTRDAKWPRRNASSSAGRRVSTCVVQSYPRILLSEKQSLYTSPAVFLWA